MGIGNLEHLLEKIEDKGIASSNPLKNNLNEEKIGNLRIYRNSSNGLTGALFGNLNEKKEVLLETNQTSKIAVVMEKEMVREEHPIDPTFTKVTIDEDIFVANIQTFEERELRGNKKKAVLPSEALIFNSKIITNGEKKTENVVLNNKIPNPKKSLTQLNSKLKKDIDVEIVQNKKNNFSTRLNNKLITNGTDKKISNKDSRNMEFPINGGGLGGGGGVANINENGEIENGASNDVENGINGSTETEQIFIKNAQVINDDEIFIANILIENGIISLVIV